MEAALMAYFDVDSYVAQLNFKGEKGSEKDFQAGGDPNAAREDAKRWVEGEAKSYIKKTPSVLEEKKWEAGSVTAVSAEEGAADTPTATLYVRSSGDKIEFDWDE